MARTLEDARWDLGGRDLELTLREARRLGGTSLARDAWRRFRRDRAARVGLWFLGLLTLLSLFAPLLPLPSPSAMQLRSEPRAPVWPWIEPVAWNFVADYPELNAADALMVKLRSKAFGELQTGPWLGTDAKGRDLLARIM